jgi:WD40 repeat protein
MTVGRKKSTIVLGTNVGVVEVRDGTTLLPLKTFEVGHPYGIYAVAIDPEEKQIAACGTDGTVLVWNVDGDTPLYHLQKTHREGERMSALAFSPDGKSLAALSRYGWLTLWDLTTGQLIGEPVEHAGGENSTLKFTPAGDRIVVIERGAIRFWHPLHEPVVRVIRPPETVCPRYTAEEELSPGARRDYGDGIRFAGVSTLSADATQIASILQNGSVAFWDLQTKQVLLTLPPPSFIKAWEFAGEYPGLYFESIRISPDGQRVAASAVGEMAVWQLLP